MKAFFVGLLIVLAVFILSGIGFLLLPLIFVLGFLLRFIASILFIFLSIWLLGKFVIFVWENWARK